MMMTRPIAVVLAVTFILGSGCAKPDWIQQTLVTADVTGTWVGYSTGRLVGGSSLEVRMEFEQQGPKVTGSYRFTERLAPARSPSGRIYGDLAGDVFRFSERDGSFAGELTVSGDEMQGSVMLGGPLPITLRRADSSPSPR